MKKVLVVGDSHAAALKHGVDAMQSELSINFEFDFCAVGRRLGGFSSLKIVNERLIVPDRLFELEGKIIFFVDKNEFMLNEYDAVVLVCAGPGAAKISSPLSIMRYHCNESLLFSSALVKSIILNFKRYPEIVSDVFQVVPEKTIVVGSPPPGSNEPCVSSILERYRNSDLSLLYEQILNCCKKINQPRLILPPRCLLSDAFFQTRQEFMVPFDHFHGNHIYGLHIVNELVRMLVATS